MPSLSHYQLILFARVGARDAFLEFFHVKVLVSKPASGLRALRKNYMNGNLDAKNTVITVPCIIMG